MPVTFTIDLEEHRPDDSYPKRFPAIMREILEFLARRESRATVFVLGRLAENEPGLIREIAAQGHEIAFHSYDHLHLSKDSAENFRQQTTRSKSYLEDLTGQAVQGYRAPAFSLTRDATWVLDILQELGFAYSSSVLPAANPINGFPGAPQGPFLWSNGLLEIPAPLARLGPLSFPYLGGIYLRYLPAFLIRYFMQRAEDPRCLWLYCHPHDFDYQEPFYTIAGTSTLTSLLLWFNRRNTFRKLEMILPPGEEQRSIPFIEQVNAGVYRDLEQFNPG